MSGRSGIFGFIVEGIDASAIDREARSVLRRVLVKELEAEWEHFSSAYPEINPPGNYKDDDYDWKAHDRASEARHQVFQYFYDTKSEHLNPGSYQIFIKHLLDCASTALQRVTQRSITARFGEVLSLHDRYEWGGEIKRSTYRGFTSDIKVRVQSREQSEDTHKHYGGYFQSNGLRVEVFVDANEVWMTAMGLVQEIIFGEGEDTEALVNTIAPVFVHEYVHLEQFIRGASKHGQNDPGIVTTGGGKRGGRRSLGTGTVPYMRYKSSFKEIESFAAQAASEIISTNRESNWESGIDNALASIATGYSMNKIADHYWDIAQGYWAEQATEEGVPPEQLTAMHHAFLKTVYQKLWTYRKQRLGKATPDTHAIKRVSKDWLDLAKKYPLGQAAAHIAYDIAFNYDDLKYGEGSDMMVRASSFLEAYYFNEHYDFEKSLKIQRAFSALCRAQHAKMSLRQAA